MADYKRLERPVIWKEFFHGQEEEEEEEERVAPIFKVEKTNMPKNHSTPEDLKIFLHAVKSDLVDPRNRNKEEYNLPQDELNALKELIDLQKSCKIVIKSCDKGAGIIVLDFNEYVKACYDHLLSETADGKSYYTQVNELEIERSKAKIENVLKEGRAGEKYSYQE